MNIPYGYRRPPITVIDRKVDFICAECGEPGVGRYNSKVHDGECRRVWNLKITKRTLYRLRDQRRLAKAAAG